MFVSDENLDKSLLRYMSVCIYNLCIIVHIKTYGHWSITFFNIFHDFLINLIKLYNKSSVHQILFKMFKMELYYELNITVGTYSFVNSYSISERE